MSEISKPKQAVDLEFLNEEIGKLRNVKKSIEEDLSYLNSSHLKKVDEFHQEISSKENKISLLERNISSAEEKKNTVLNDIISSTKILSDLNDAIKKNNSVVSDSVKNLSIREQNVKESENNNRKDRDSLLLVMQDIERNRKDIENIRQALKEQEDGLEAKSNLLSSTNKLLDERTKKIENDEKENRKTFELNASRSADIQHQAEELNIDKRNFEITKQDSINRDNNIQGKLDTFKSIQEDLDKQIKITDERDRLSVIREQKAILKDEELRIREKRISLKEQAQE